MQNRLYYQSKYHHSLVVNVCSPSRFNVLIENLSLLRFKMSIRSNTCHRQFFLIWSLVEFSQLLSYEKFFSGLYHLNLGFFSYFFPLLKKYCSSYMDLVIKNQGQYYGPSYHFYPKHIYLFLFDWRSLKSRQSIHLCLSLVD